MISVSVSVKNKKKHLVCVKRVIFRILEYEAAKMEVLVSQ